MKYCIQIVNVIHKIFEFFSRAANICVNDLPFRHITDETLVNDVLLPKNNATFNNNVALDFIMDNDHIDYSVLGNIDPDTNFLSNDNSLCCGYYIFRLIQYFHCLT